MNGGKIELEKREEEEANRIYVYGEEEREKGLTSFVCHQNVLIA